MLKTGIERIAAERQRQISAEGWSAAHDDAHDSGEMAVAALCYLANVVDDIYPDLLASSAPLHGPGSMPDVWPWSSGWWKPKTPVQDLVRAGALIAAEIDRRLRAGESIEPQE